MTTVTSWLPSPRSTARSPLACERREGLEAIGIDRFEGEVNVLQGERQRELR